MELSPLAQRAFADLLRRATGQQLSEERSWRIGTALHPVLRRHGLESLEALAARLGSAAAPLQAEVVEALLNHETSFFRDAAMFRLLDEQALPALAAARADARRLRIWSAGCATGQESHSLAMLIAGRPAQWDGWQIDLLGTDVSPAAIDQARGGLYAQLEVQRGLPIGLMLAHFRPDGEAWRFQSTGRPRQSFVVHNLLAEQPHGRFDLILCRNVLLYFAPPQRALALARLAAALAPDGLLVLGAGETLLGHTDAFVPAQDLRGLYRRA